MYAWTDHSTSKILIKSRTCPRVVALMFAVKLWAMLWSDTYFGGPGDLWLTQYTSSCAIKYRRNRSTLMTSTRSLPRFAHVLSLSATRMPRLRIFFCIRPALMTTAASSVEPMYKFLHRRLKLCRVCTAALLDSWLPLSLTVLWNLL